MNSSIFFYSSLILYILQKRHWIQLFVRSLIDSQRIDLLIKLRWNIDWFISSSSPSSPLTLVTPMLLSNSSISLADAFPFILSSNFTASSDLSDTLSSYLKSSLSVFSSYSQWPPHISPIRSVSEEIEEMLWSDALSSSLSLNNFLPSSPASSTNFPIFSLIHSFLNSSQSLSLSQSRNPFDSLFAFLSSRGQFFSAIQSQFEFIDRLTTFHMNTYQSILSLPLFFYQDTLTPSLMEFANQQGLDLSNILHILPLFLNIYFNFLILHNRFRAINCLLHAITLQTKYSPNHSDSPSDLIIIKKKVLIDPSNFQTNSIPSSSICAITAPQSIPAPSTYTTASYLRFIQEFTLSHMEILQSISRQLLGTSLSINLNF
jgi:hypothetical protein